MDKLLTATELAERLGVSLSKAYALKETIGYVAVGGNVRFEPAAVDAYIERCKRGPIEGEKDRWASQSVIERPARGGSSPKRMDLNVINQLLERNKKRSSTRRSGVQR
ncbi:excisionase family DNA binding protein [Modicisalibacter xianhensis]|uniref:Excisionase family DNA binding protein n=1 Tax=Modicisalibacter xianhensis TaxID=442341 RepID=A0A4R8G2K6_9GAMM|nr:helix-turn-helix domain-containing protein [Halomonas xianhensis]TDX30816.1 excisionase family DNA binding protein [Halomonas xianhensis]